MATESNPEEKPRPRSAQTRCPFCDGSILLELVESDVSRNDALTRLSGFEAVCPHRGCGRTFAVRRREITLRMR